MGLVRGKEIAGDNGAQGDVVGTSPFFLSLMVSRKQDVTPAVCGDEPHLNRPKAKQPANPGLKSPKL